MEWKCPTESITIFGGFVALQSTSDIFSRIGHCVNCKETKYFVDIKPCASKNATGISIPILLISASNPDITLNDCDTNSNASGGNFKSKAAAKKSFTTFVFQVGIL